MRFKNYMEEVVLHMIPSILSQIDCCRCERCVADVAAIVLNNVPPKYVVTEEGEVYMKVNELRNQFEVDVTTAIINAANIVKNNPKHAIEGGNDEK